jgi:hypothetical protein
MTRLKLAELKSGIGALVLGTGLGALFPHWFAPAAGLIALAGVVAHGFGMWDKHRLEAQAHVENEPWVIALYWACWLLLAGVVMFVFIRR